MHSKLKNEQTNGRTNTEYLPGSTGPYFHEGGRVTMEIGSWRIRTDDVSKWILKQKCVPRVRPPSLTTRKTVSSKRETQGFRWRLTSCYSLLNMNKTRFTVFPRTAWVLIWLWTGAHMHTLPLSRAESLAGWSRLCVQSTLPTRTSLNVSPQFNGIYEYTYLGWLFV